MTMSCSTEDKCRRCTGTVTNIGDWTVCDNEGNVIRANNLTEEAETSTNTFP